MMERVSISWSRIPFVRFVISLLAGILLAVFLGVEERFGWATLAMGALYLLLLPCVRAISWRMRLEKGAGLAVFLALSGLGIILVDFHTEQDESDHFSHAQGARFIHAEVVDVPQEKAKTFKLILKVEKVGEEGDWREASGKLLAYMQKEKEAAELSIGDVVVIPCEFNEVAPPANPGEFNYKRFLSFKDIYQQAYVPEGNWILIEQRWRLRAVAEEGRRYLRSRIDIIGMSDDEEAISAALLLGKKDELGPELSRSYASAGAMHVLAVSGLHVGIIFFILQGIFKLAGYWRKGLIWPSVIVIIGLWVYAFITGLSPSVVRAATMFSAVTLGNGINRQSDVYNTISSSAFLLLLFNPFYIMEVGFQLSYLAVIGIIYLHPRIYALLYFPQKVWDYLWQITCVSIAAQIATFPLGVLYFHQFPTYFLLSNLVVIPAAFLILYIGVAYFALGWIPGLGSLIGKALGWSIYGLNVSVAWVESMPGSLLQGLDIGILETWLIYVLIGFLIYFWFYRSKPAMLWAGATLSLLMIIQVQELYSLKRFEHLVIYDVRGKSVVNLVGEEENILICDSLFAMSKDRQQFHLQNNWNRLNAAEPEYVVQGRSPRLEYLTEAMFRYHGKTFAQMNNRQALDSLQGEQIPIDYLIISWHKGLDPEAIFKKFNAKEIILDGTVRGKTIERIKEALPKEKKLFSINENGYYMQRL